MAEAGTVTPTTESSVLPPDDAEIAATTGNAEDAQPDDQQLSDEQRNEQVKQEAAEKAERRRRGVERRIDELTRDKHAERAAREALERANAQLLAMVKKTEAPAAEAGAGRPDQSKFTDYAEYLRADAAWIARDTAKREAEAAIRLHTDQMSRTNAQQAEQAAQRAYAERAKEAAKNLPDFNTVMQDADVEIPTPILAAIRDMDDGPVIAYHMAKNPDLAQQFFGKSYPQQMLLLGQMSASLRTSNNKVSNAPPPGKPGSPKGGASGSEPPEDTEAYFAWAKKHMK
jgi:hypothetical protein